MVSPLLKLPQQVYKSFKTIFFDATLTRDGDNSGDAYDPETAAATVYTCKAIAEYTSGTSGSDIVGSSDAKVLILAASLSVTPEPLDRIAIAIQGFSGVIANDPRAIKSDPALATYECRVVT